MPVDKTATERRILSSQVEDLGCGVKSARTLTTIDEIRIKPDSIKIIESVYLSEATFAEGAEPLKKVSRVLKPTDDQLKSLFDSVKKIITGD